MTPVAQGAFTPYQNSESPDQQVIELVKPEYFPFLVNDMATVALPKAKEDSPLPSVYDWNNQAEPAPASVKVQQKSDNAADNLPRVGVKRVLWKEFNEIAEAAGSAEASVDSVAAKRFKS